MSTPQLLATVGAVLATGAIEAAVLAYLLGRPRVSVFVEDPTAPVEGCECEDEMDAYLQQRVAGHRVLPPEPPPTVVAPIHYQCYDAYTDREPSRMCDACRVNLAGAPR